MKKIAIVSCYFKHNYGSMLQALATQMVLDKLGYENETIDITNINKELKISKLMYFIKASLTSRIFFTKFGMVKNIIKKKISNNEYSKNSDIRSKKFDEFSKKNFRMSERYSSKKELNEKCYDNYFAVLVGSDQLWLPANIAADYYTLSFVPENVNSIAYSTSFGQANLPKDSSEKARKFLKRIKHLSVREESGKKLVKNLIGRDVPVVCDPTLLFTGEEWLAIQKTEPIIKEKYILCYFLGKNPLHREFAKKLSKKTDCIIVALTHLDEFVASDEDYADLTPYNVDPSDFLNLVKNASYVCTDSFHCTIFSTLYKKTFFTFKRYKSTSKFSTNNRLDNLLGILGLEERFLEGTENIEECLKMKIDFLDVLNRISNIREESYLYLKQSLEN